jgi:methyl acetate hydrolase
MPSLDARSTNSEGFEMSDLPTNARATPTRTQPSKTIDAALRKAVENREIAGVVAIAVERQRVLYQGCFGAADIARRRPLSADAVFNVASMTKPVTSISAMQLIEQGRFALDDPVEKHLPEFADPRVFEWFDAVTGEYRLRPASGAVTVRHLFTHTSGLGYPVTSPIIRDFKPRDGEDYPIGPLLFDPGERWLYGTSFTWLGRLVQKISGKPLENYFQDHVFRPLGMSDSSYFVPDNKQDRLVKLNRRQADGAIVTDASQPPTSDFTPIGGGGLWSTAGDYILFLRMLLNGGELGGHRIVSAETVDLMAENHIGSLAVRALKTAVPEFSDDLSFVADGRDKWGLGFLITADDVPGKRAAGSLSWCGIYNTYFWVDRFSGIAGVIMMQFLPFADRKALAIYDAFERGVYQAAAA